nr:hypothetical protein [Deltaproteobacteria bacterium]
LPVTAVRVFETNRPGSTFAVVDLTHGEQLLYEGMPRTESGARVLEVAVDPPRAVRRLRVYVVNPGWAEIDTVGLLAAAPLPEALRVRRPPPVRNGCLSVAAGLSIVAFALAVIGAAVWQGSARGPSSTRASIRQRPRPALTVGQASIVRSPVDVDELTARSVRWASEVIGFSSEYSSTANAAAGVRFAPDVYLRHGDIAGAWASSATDGGEEWIEVRFASPVAAVSVLWLETFNAGAVTRVDDVTDPAAPAVLWEGAPTRVAGSVVAEVLLPARRTIGAVRLVLDSRAVPGWNEIDAIGLVAARGGLDPRGATGRSRHRREGSATPAQCATAPLRDRSNPVREARFHEGAVSWRQPARGVAGFGGARTPVTKAGGPGTSIGPPDRLGVHDCGPQPRSGRTPSLDWGERPNPGAGAAPPPGPEMRSTIRA